MALAISKSFLLTGQSASLVGSAPQRGLSASFAQSQSISRPGLRPSLGSIRAIRSADEATLSKSNVILSRSASEVNVSGIVIPSGKEEIGDSAASPPPAKAARKNLVQIHTVSGFELALKVAKDKLVIVQFAEKECAESAEIYLEIVKLSQNKSTGSNTVFLLVLGDDSAETVEICRRANVKSFPFVQFYKNKELIYEEKRISPEILAGGIMYYGENDAPIRQLHSQEEMGALMQDHSRDGDSRLLVVDVSLKNCGPCAKVYPTVVNLSKQMEDYAVFARIFGDENDSCKNLMRDLEVKEVPTFLFIKGGEICGRYVGSGKGELIGEVLRYQGVQCT